MFTSDRFSAEEIPQIAKDSGRAVKGLAKRFFHLPGNTVSMIEPGQASVVETPKGAAGVYRAEDNRIYQIDVVCPHLGCRLVWNQEERSWDCPCHGSRFDYRGMFPIRQFRLNREKEMMQIGILWALSVIFRGWSAGTQYTACSIR